MAIQIFLLGCCPSSLDGGVGRNSVGRSCSEAQ